MAPLTVTGIDELRDTVGKTLGPSDWREVTQEMIDTFADLSGDHQWIHVDRERGPGPGAGRSPDQGVDRDGLGRRDGRRLVPGGPALDRRGRGH